MVVHTLSLSGGEDNGSPSHEVLQKIIKRVVDRTDAPRSGLFTLQRFWSFLAERTDSSQSLVYSCSLPRLKLPVGLLVGSV